jgi:hypothetical protein
MPTGRIAALTAAEILAVALGGAAWALAIVAAVIVFGSLLFIWVKLRNLAQNVDKLSENTTELTQKVNEIRKVLPEADTEDA